MTYVYAVGVCNKMVIDEVQTTVFQTNKAGVVHR